MTATTTHYVKTHLPDVKIGRTTYKVEVWYHEWVDGTRPGETRSSTMTVLTGPRGAQYEVHPLRYPADGVCALYSLGSGRELRVAGNVVRVVHLGDIIEAI